MRMDELSALLTKFSFRYRNESELQAGLEAVFLKFGLEAEREVALGPKDRIDFMVDRIGIEVKTKGSPDALLRQVKRYLSHDRVEQLLVVTSRHSHTKLLDGVFSKPVDVVVVRPIF